MARLLKNKKAIIMFIAPAFILFTLVLFVPICKAIYYSFCNYKALHPIKFNGVSNYVKLFTKDKAMAAALISHQLLKGSFRLLLSRREKPQISEA